MRQYMCYFKMFAYHFDGSLYTLPLTSMLSHGLATEHSTVLQRHQAMHGANLLSHQ